MILFKCERLAATLRPEACGKKFAQIASGSISTIRSYGTSSEIGQCRDCPIGKLHAKGKRSPSLEYLEREVGPMHAPESKHGPKARPNRYLLVERVCKHEGCEVRFLAKGRRFYCDEHKS